MDARIQAERIKAVKAMEFLARQINNENIFESWLTMGPADGDIKYGDLEVKPEDAEDLEYYIEDNEFRDLMKTFLNLMTRAKKDGGLYCGNVCTEKTLKDFCVEAILSFTLYYVGQICLEGTGKKGS